jgi:hypothetical protein
MKVILVVPKLKSLHPESKKDKQIASSSENKSANSPTDSEVGIDSRVKSQTASNKTPGSNRLSLSFPDSTASNINVRISGTGSNLHLICLIFQKFIVAREKPIRWLHK